MPLPSPEPGTVSWKSSQDEKPGLSAFGGVFTPSILTILGVIMYLRFGWVLGHVGLINTLIIVTLSTSITFFTGLSISAIATDQVVRAGGAYYMISRSLGIETGGAVGIPLFFAQALSVALYTLGFAESVVRIFPNLNLTMVAFIVTILVTLLALKSAEIAIKAQYFIMAAIVVSLICLALGQPIGSASALDLAATPVEEPGSVGFWAVLAVFFPAVTGIMSGVNMSGDLKDPSKAIPVGTLAAIGVGYVIYMVIPLFLSQQADSATLIADPLIMRRIAIWGDSILLGVWGATLSSAIGSILGAPRVLQALARDGVLPKSLRWLGKGSGPQDEPRLGTLFSLGVALAAVSIGDLNLIAPVLTMFFLTTYMVLNVAAGIEGFLQSPSFRPTFKVPWIFSLLGAVGCISIMFLINAIATVVAALIVLGIYLWLERREIEGTWGDIRQGIWLSLIRTGLFRIKGPLDSKNWRPHLLVFSGAPTKRWHLLDMANALTHQRGLFTVASVLPEGSRDVGRQESMEMTLQDYLEKRGIQAFVRLVTASDPFQGMKQLIEAYGIGPLLPNTVLLGDTENPQGRDRFSQLVAQCHKAKRNVVILRSSPEQFTLVRRRPARFRRIDVWWGGLQANGGLMLILAYLLRTSWDWRGAEICLKLVVPDQAAAASAEENLMGLTASLRIGAVPQVIVANGRSFDEILLISSQTADLVLIGLATPGSVDDFSEYYTKLQHRITDLPNTLLVMASEELSFSEVLQKD
ncbi:amino acid permease [Oscillatoria sp. CS-180]|uniref:amino acid permease n=1 Tax=Oscillatoria sp. CS-180 TaxID=3021720 RepID=UPI0023302EDD|nr:amino acid permease [Oscillatoria sp. CS-180]MDB9525719.1 amino acid permease [Oscillatoria sp. CS-180]